VPDCDCDPRFPEDAPAGEPDCAWPVNGGVPSGLPGRDYVSCHQPGSGHEAEQQVGNGSAVLRYSVCIRHFHTAAEAGWTIRHVSLDVRPHAPSSLYATAADRVRAARDEALDDAAARSLPSGRISGPYRPAGVVPVAVAGVVLGTAVGLAALGMARDAVEARVAQYRAARAARKGWPG
jgi:hypothetical protein